MLAKIYECRNGRVENIAVEIDDLERVLKKWKDKCVIEFYDEESGKRLLLYVNI